MCLKYGKCLASIYQQQHHSKSHVVPLLQVVFPTSVQILRGKRSRHHTPRVQRWGRLLQSVVIRKGLVQHGNGYSFNRLNVGQEEYSRLNVEGGISAEAKNKESTVSWGNDNYCWVPCRFLISWMMETVLARWQALDLGKYFWEGLRRPLPQGVCLFCSGLPTGLWSRVASLGLAPSGRCPPWPWECLSHLHPSSVGCWNWVAQLCLVIFLGCSQVSYQTLLNGMDWSGGRGWKKITTD